MATRIATHAALTNAKRPAGAANEQAENTDCELRYHREDYLNSTWRWWIA